MYVRMEIHNTKQANVEIAGVDDFAVKADHNNFRELVPQSTLKQG